VAGTRKHISFSELKNWDFCPYSHKLIYIDGIDAFQGNEFTAFGTAIHDTCEQALLNKNNINHSEHFLNSFLEELKKLKQIDLELKPDLVNSMRTQGITLAPLAIPALKEYFGKFELVSTEENLYVPFEKTKTGEDFYFKGFIDVALKTEDGKYHIIDWKTCSWGWDQRRKAEPMTNYQLVLYKHFFALKHGIDPKNVETHFALLKRTAKNNHVELFRVTSGKKKTENALNLLNTAIYNIKKERYIKKRLACTSGFGCDFYDTEHCSR
jgi:hypothetical protein